METMLVIVEGITQKGKNRVNEHGACWKIIEERNGRLLLEPLNSPGYFKWGPEPDFRFVTPD